MCDAAASYNRSFVSTCHLGVPFIYRPQYACVRSSAQDRICETSSKICGLTMNLGVLVAKSKRALIVVDVQNDFVDPKGNLYVQDAPAVVPQINLMIADARADGRLIVYTQDWHPEVTPHFAKDGGIWPVHCVAGSWGAEFYPELDVHPSPQVVKKGTDGEDGYSGFSMRDPETGVASETSLQAQLERRGVEEVDVVGIATDYCVKETALDARRLSFKTRVYQSCMKGVDLKPGDSDAAIAEMAEAGVEVIDG